MKLSRKKRIICKSKKLLKKQHLRQVRQVYKTNLCHSKLYRKNGLINAERRYPKSLEYKTLYPRNVDEHLQFNPQLYQMSQ